MKGALVGLAVLTLGAGSALARASDRIDSKGLSMTVGGGVEGYTEALAPRIELGPTYGVTVGLRVNRRLGLEVGYSGAAHELDTGAPGGATRGMDLIRNGAHAVATVGLTPTTLQPYVMGGLGFSGYNIRGGMPGFGDDTVGNIPLGAGVRTTFGTFTADARLHYNLLFDQQLVAGAPVPGMGEPTDLTLSRGGRYSGTLNLGLLW
jgi:opacity protein-like surface antigen